MILQLDEPIQPQRMKRRALQEKRQNHGMDLPTMAKYGEKRIPI